MPDPLPPVEPIRAFLAGPVYVPEDARRAMLQELFEHRSAAFRATWERLGSGLQGVFRTKGDVVLATGSATLLLEAGIVSLVDGPLLVLTCGAFSERWLGIAQSLGRETVELAVPWGEVHDPDSVRKWLRKKQFRAVAMVHSETSTGVLEPVAELAQAVRGSSDALVLVDAVSSLAASPVETDAWGLDYVVTGSQKGLAAPPGLAVAALSHRALERARKVGSRGFYLDLVRYVEQHRAGGPISTPAMSVCWALARQLDRIAQEGLEARWARHRACAGLVESWAKARGIPLTGPVGFRSPALSCLELGADRDLGAFRRALEARGFRISGGYGRWRHSTVRIGHLGEVRPTDLQPMLEAFDEEWERWSKS